MSDRHDVVVRMPAELHAALKRRAAEDGMSMAEAMRTALRAYVEAHDPERGKTGTAPSHRGEGAAPTETTLRHSP